MTYAIRALRRTPGLTLTAIAALALGMGATTAIFSVVNKVLLEPLPYPDPDRLVQLMSTSSIGDQTTASIPKFVTWRDHAHAFESVAAYEIGAPGVTLTEGEFPEALRAVRVSAAYFRLFGAQVLIGRPFTEAEDQPGGPRVAILSQQLWRARFHRDPMLVGRTISLDAESYKVIGILDPRFPVESPGDLWLPLQADPSAADHANRVHVVARLKPNISLAAARENVRKTIVPFTRSYTGAPMLHGEVFTAIPLRDALVGDTRRALYLLAGAVAFVLLICCANVANLLLARGTRRAREMALRTALGAKRKQIVHLLLTESFLLALAGGAVGLVAGYFGVRQLLALSPADIPRIGANGAAISLDWRIALFTLLISLSTAILFGLAPALETSRADLSSLVKDSTSQSGMGLLRTPGRSALVIGEMALALVLLAGAGLLIRTFVSARAVNRGFGEDNVVTVEMSIPPQFERTSQIADLVNSVERRLHRVRGVIAAGATCALPLEPSLNMPFSIEGRDRSHVGRYHGTAVWRSISPEYFDVFQIRLLRGRHFTDNDGQHSVPVVIINRAMARRYWPDLDANPIGDYIRIGEGLGPQFEEGPRQVVGIVADVRDAGLNREPMVYVPTAQLADELNARNNRLFPLKWIVRTAAGPALPSSTIQAELKAASGGIPIQRVRTMREIVAASSARTEFYMLLLVVFAAVAVLLAAVGLSSLMAYSVQQRTLEIGIRMALGADAADVRAMVVWQGLRLALLGIAAGLPLALALSQIMGSLIFGIPAWDPFVFASVASLLAAVALTAAYIPSIRATRVDPMTALR